MAQREKEVEEVLRFARAYCAEQLPWFAPVLFRCQIQLSSAVEIAGIDQRLNIYFNPAAVREIQRSGAQVQALAQLGFLWVHEISHILREHAPRAGELAASPLHWNIAADLEINDSRWSGLEMPTIFPGLLPRSFRLPEGRLAEWYYQQLRADEAELKARLLLLLPTNAKAEHLDEGSGIHQHPRPWEMAEGGQSRQHLDELTLEVIRRQVAQEMRRHHRAGGLPGGWARWVTHILRPKVNWRQVLRHRLSMAVTKGVGQRIDYSFQRPNRRQSVYYPLLPPTLTGNLTARLTVIVDTSDSMTPSMLGLAVGAVWELLQTFQVPVTVIPCDAQTYPALSIAQPSRLFKLRQLAGGGGTNLRVALDEATRQQSPPDAVLILTDGFTPFPGKPADIPVVFGIFQTADQESTPRPPNPPWSGDTVVLIPVPA